MKHVNEIRFEGKTPWVKVMNEANDYWIAYNKATTEKEKDMYFDMWSDIRCEIELGLHGNNSTEGG